MKKVTTKSRIDLRNLPDLFVDSVNNYMKKHGFKTASKSVISMVIRCQDMEELCQALHNKNQDLQEELREKREIVEMIRKAIKKTNEL